MPQPIDPSLPPRAASHREPGALTRRVAACLMMIVAAAAPARAQVGYEPEASPFRDLEYRQELTGFVGWFNAGDDVAGVAPQGGPIMGARYDVRVGGPAMFSARVARVASDRRVVDPTKPEAERLVGEESWPLYVGDVSLAINLTGQKSWRRLVPVVSGGAGLVSDFESDADVGGYQFGTQFAFSFGAGVRYVPGGRFQARVDLTDWLYQVEYPESYRVDASDGTSVIRDSQPLRNWKHNVAITIGASYLFFR